MVGPIKQKMKFCKAWPEECLTKAKMSLSENEDGKDGQNGGSKETTNSNNSNDISNDIIVLPKHFDTIVDNTVKSIIEQTFPDDPIDEKSIVPFLTQKTTASEKTKLKKSKFKDNTNITLRGTKSIPNENVSTMVTDTPKQVTVVQQQDLTPIYVAMGIFAFVALLIILSLYNRIQTLEAWLHGRLMSQQ